MKATNRMEGPGDFTIKALEEERGQPPYESEWSQIILPRASSQI